MSLAPEPAPTVQQLLAFYLEAGVDCALADTAVDRLAEPDSATLASPRENPAQRLVREVPAPAPSVSRSEIAPAPEAAIASAREAARTAPSLEALRALLENFDGCALKHTATRLVFVAVAPVDGRKSFNGLHILVKEVLQQDPTSGHLCIRCTRYLLADCD